VRTSLKEHLRVTLRAQVPAVKRSVVPLISKYRERSSHGAFEVQEIHPAARDVRALRHRESDRPTRERTIRDEALKRRRNSHLRFSRRRASPTPIGGSG